MVKEKIGRKIAVIFATDIVDYSKHMETDESETIHNSLQYYVLNRLYIIIICLLIIYIPN